MNAPNAPKRAPNVVPKLPAFTIVEPGSLRAAVWCEHCRRWHFHGAPGAIPGESGGHRAAHCSARIYLKKGAPVWESSNSPYLETGYELEIVGPASPAMLRDMRRRRPRGPARILAEMVAETVNDSLAAETVNDSLAARLKAPGTNMKVVE